MGGTDTLTLDSPAAKHELEILRGMKVGDVRTGTLLPALDVPLEWQCTAAQDKYWTFDALFFGVVVHRVVIEQQTDALVLRIEE